MKSLIILLFLAALINFSAKSQNFGPVGAMWHIDLGIGYQKFVVEKDTIYQGKNVRKVVETSFGSLNKTWFMFDGGGKVYFFIDTIAYKVYDFNAKKGDSWEIPNFFHGCSNNLKSLVTVDSVGSDTINNLPLKFVDISWSDPMWTFNGFYTKKYRMIEKIGGNGSLLPYYGCIADGEYPGNLRCYSDSGFNYHPVKYQCDSVGVGVSELESGFSAYPNPSSSKVKIQFEQNSKFDVELFNNQGQLVAVHRNCYKETEINQHVPGIYFARIILNNRQVFTKKVIVQN